MPIGLTGGAASVDGVVAQAKRAEADGFSALWYASIVTGDPLVAIPIAGRTTERIELGTAVLQTYPCHPLLQANRAASVADAMGRPGFTLGVGPSHEPVVRDVLGLSYAHPGTEHRGVRADPDRRGAGRDRRLRRARLERPYRRARRHPAASRPGASRRSVRGCCGSPASTRTERFCGWRRRGRSNRISHRRIRAAAAAAGRPSPRIVAGLPVAVHDDVAEARAAAATSSRRYGSMANYQRILEIGDASTAADAAIVGDEASVAAQLQALLDAGATDIWAAIFPVGADRARSVQRTRALLAQLAS